MKIGILADTHIRKGKSLPRCIWDKLEDVDAILHAGDLVTENVLEELAILAPVTAVKGNCDWLIEELPSKIITKLGRIRVGLTHGYLGKGNSTQQRAYNTFAEEQVDIIIFGHSHIPFKSFMDGVLMFNPGSPTEKRGQPYYSLGIMTVEEDIFEVEHLFFNY